MCKIHKEAVVACVKMMVQSLFKRTVEEYKRKCPARYLVPGALNTQYPSYHGLFTLMIQDFCRVKRKP
jgi:hypothetical protein